jgi:hypothetical protein
LLLGIPIEIDLKNEHGNLSALDQEIKGEVVYFKQKQ